MMKVRQILKFGIVCTILVGSLIGCSSTRNRSETLSVGRISENRYFTPTGQILSPAGHQVHLPGLRPQALALSPDGTLVVTSGKNNQLYVIDATKGGILQKVAMPGVSAQSSQASKTDAKALLSLTGLVFSPDNLYPDKIMQPSACP